MNFLKKTLVAFFAALMLVFSGNLSYYAHFCRGELVEAQFIFPVDACSDAAATENNTCEAPVKRNSSKESVHQTDCCEDVSQHFSVDSHSTTKFSSGIVQVQMAIPIVFGPYFTNSVPQFSADLPRPPPLGQKATGQHLRIMYSSQLC